MNGLTARKKSVSTAVCGFISMTDRAANQRIFEKLKDTDINAKILIPYNKDWNEDLLMRNNGGETQCQAVQS